MTEPANPAFQKMLMDVPVRVEVVLGADHQSRVHVLRRGLHMVAPGGQLQFGLQTHGRHRQWFAGFTVPIRELGHGQQVV